MGYTGIANIGGSTLDWTGRILSTRDVKNPGQAINALKMSLEVQLARLDPEVRRHTAVFAGFGQKAESDSIFPYVLMTSNFYEGSGRWNKQADRCFGMYRRTLEPTESVWAFTIGTPIEPRRELRLLRNLRKIVKRGLSPMPALRLASLEILHNSIKTPLVGKKLLAACIPRKSAESAIANGNFFILAGTRSMDHASFFYFDPGAQEFIQKGPAIFADGGFITNVAAGNL